MNNTVQLSSNFVDSSHLSKRALWEETIEVWDYLVEHGYHPADFSTGIVTMRYGGFVRIAREVSGTVSIKESPHYRTSSVWFGNIEINYTEFKSGEQWTLIDNWEPLE